MGKILGYDIERNGKVCLNIIYALEREKDKAIDAIMSNRKLSDTDKIFKVDMAISGFEYKAAHYAELITGDSRDECLRAIQELLYK